MNQVENLLRKKQQLERLSDHGLDSVVRHETKKADPSRDRLFNRQSKIRNRKLFTTRNGVGQLLQFRR
jgi:hypothetical protein